MKAQLRPFTLAASYLLSRPLTKEQTIAKRFKDLNGVGAERGNSARRSWKIPTQELSHIALVQDSILDRDWSFALGSSDAVG